MADTKLEMDLEWVHPSHFTVPIYIKNRSQAGHPLTEEERRYLLAGIVHGRGCDRASCVIAVEEKV